MKKYIKDIFKLIIFLSLGVFFIWLSLRGLDEKQRAEIWTGAQSVLTDGSSWTYLGLCILIGFISVIIRARRWRLMIEPIGYKVSKTNAYHAIMVCYLANMAIPRLGELLRCTLLQRYDKVPFQKSLGTVITERIIDLMFAGLLFLMAIGLEYNKVLTFMSQSGVQEKFATMFSSTGKYILAGSFLLIAGLVFIFRKRIAALSFFQKIINLIKGFWDGLVSIKNIQKKWLFILYSVLIWVCYYLMFFTAALAFEELRMLGGDLALASLSCVAIGSIGFIVAQGGLGAYPFFVALMLSLYGISHSNGLSTGWVIWGVEEAMYLLLGLLSVVMLALKKEQRTE